MKIIQLLLNSGNVWDRSISKELVINNHLHMLKWIYENGYPFHKKIYEDAIEYDDEEIIGWLGSIGYARK